MDRILSGLRSTASSDDAVRASARLDKRTHAKANYTALACASIVKLHEGGYMNRSGEYETVRWRGDERAAWVLRDWPPFDLPHGVTSYKVYLVAIGSDKPSAEIVSARVTHGREMLEVYDPDRYGDSDPEALTVFSAAAKLPRNFYFEKEWMEPLR